MKMIKDTFANWRSVHKFYFLFNILTPLVSPSSPRKTTMWFLVLAPELFVCSTKLTWGRDYYIMLWQAAFNNVFTLKANSFFLIFTKISNILFKRKGHVDRHWSLYTNITGPSAKTTFNPSFWQQILQSFLG